MGDRRRLIFRIVGLVLIAAALGLIGYSAWDLLSTDAATNQSLQEAENFLKNMQSGSPLDTIAPGATDATVGQDPAATGDPSLDTGTDPFAGGDATNPTDDESSPAPGGTARPKSTYKPDYLGILVLDSLGGRKVPILNGVTNRELSRGAAHHPRSSKPGAVGNCVLYGHRNTVFRGFGSLKIGDSIHLMLPGKTLTYRIVKMSVIEPNDPQIFKAYGQAALTLVTCYPFHYVGSAPQRYLVVAMPQD